MRVAGILSALWFIAVCTVLICGPQKSPTFNDRWNADVVALNARLLSPEDMATTNGWLIRPCMFDPRTGECR